jgi:hypothetical protein
MAEQTTAHINPALIAESIDVLAKQMALFKKEPSTYVAQALVVMQAEICELKEVVADLKDTIQTLRSLSPHLTISLLQNQRKANP